MRLVVRNLGFANFAQSHFRKFCKESFPQILHKVISANFADSENLNYVRIEDLCEETCKWIGLLVMLVKTYNYSFITIPIKLLSQSHR